MLPNLALLVVGWEVDTDLGLVRRGGRDRLDGEDALFHGGNGGSCVSERSVRKEQVGEEGETDANVERTGVYKVEMRVGIRDIPLVKIAQLKSKWDMKVKDTKRRVAYVQFGGT